MIISMDRKINKKKIIILILIIFIILLIAVFSILYQRNETIRVFLDEYVFRKNVTENTLPKISVENTHTFAFKDYIVVLDNNILDFYNKSATKVFSFEDIEISEPIFETNGDFLCIAEKNGSKIYLISNRNIVWQKNVNGNISNLSVNKNGYVNVSISDTTYKTICTVYDENGSELFTNYLANSYIIDSSISNDNKFLAFAEANFSGITIQSNIKIISIDNAIKNSADTTYYNYSAPAGDLIINIEYCNNDLVCLYDNHIDIIKDQSSSTITNFKDNNILFADINNKLVQIEKHTTGILSSEFEVQIIDTNNLERKTYSLKREPKSIKIFGNVIAINLGTELLFINNSGWLIKNYTSSHEVQEIVLSNDLAGIIYKDKIEILSL